MERKAIKMDKIQKVLIKSGRKDLAQRYYKKIAQNKKSDAKEVADILNKEKGEKYAANWTGATDKAVVKKATVIKINRGKGFEDCVKCEVSDAAGFYIYIPPFLIENMPTDKTIFIFKCDDAIYVQE